MRFSSSLLSFLVPLAAADWTTDNYDAIVVGSGPAGIITAYRLASANLSTLLLEAGGPSYGITGGNLTERRPAWLEGTNLSRVDVPGLYKSIFDSSTTGQAALTCGSSVNAFGGCTIGGSSAVNAGLFFQPPASDWDLYFPEGWKSADVQNATQRLYDMQPSTNDTSLNGQRYLQSGYDAARSWLVDGAGFQEVDINAEADNKTEVFGRPIFDYRDGQRGGPVVNYLQAALQLPNFHLQSNVSVIRVERTVASEGSNSTASGVTAMVNGTETTISLSATGRVVLSGGALRSPAILMYSGVGPAEKLNSLATGGYLSLPATQWVNNSAVGTGLFDNPNTFIELSGPSIHSYVYSFADPPETDESLYLETRSGPYTFASETSVFWDTHTRDDGSVAGFQGTIDSSGFGEYLDNDTITLNIYGTSGLRSRGSVVLDGKGIAGPDQNVYYSVASDATEIAGFISKIFAGLAKSTSGLVPRNIDASATVEEIAKYISTPSQYAVGQTNHWSSSCEIGSCVGVDLEVVGVQGVHVVDASVLAPLTVNPQFGVMVAAERGSELILKSMGLSIDC